MLLALFLYLLISVQQFVGGCYFHLAEIKVGKTGVPGVTPLKKLVKSRILKKNL